MASSISTTHNLTWSVDDEDPKDRHRGWRYASFEQPVDTLLNYDLKYSDVLQLNKRMVRTIRVTYRGPQPINPDILVARYERIFVEESCDPFLRICCCPCWLFYCIFSPQEQAACNNDCCTKGSERKKQENADHINAFVQKTLMDADAEVDRRIAAISRGSFTTGVAPIMPPNAVPTNELSALREQVSQLQQANYQAEIARLQAELALAKASEKAPAKAAPSLTTPLLPKGNNT